MNALPLGIATNIAVSIAIQLLKEERIILPELKRFEGNDSKQE